MTGGVRNYNWQRSAAQTDIAPTSVAQSGTGNGPAAVSSGEHTASMTCSVQRTAISCVVQPPEQVSQDCGLLDLLF